MPHSVCVVSGVCIDLIYLHSADKGQKMVTENTPNFYNSKIHSFASTYYILFI